MSILVLNSGSSSLKYRLYGPDLQARGLVEGLNTPHPRVVHTAAGATISQDLPAATDHQGAVRLALALCAEGEAPVPPAAVRAVGHRVVHGGEEFTRPVLISPAVIAAIERHIPLAPLHNPANLAGIRAARGLLPDCPQVAVFDTAFHATLPEHAYLYALPYAWYRRHRIRRYGFHGISHQYVAGRIRERLGPGAKRTIICHLGNGASVTAVRDGRSVDTSMGFTPLEGLVMGTRSGDLDPALVLYAQTALGLSPAEVDRVLNHESGLLGLSGLSPDLRAIEAGLDGGEEGAGRAFRVMVYRLVKYIGAYTAALGGLDCLVFTAGMGENSPRLRAAVVAGLEYAGVRLDPAANAGTGPDERAISHPQSRVAVWVIPTDEEALIARATSELLEGGNGLPDDRGE